MSGPTEEYVKTIRALDESSLVRSYWHFYWEDERSHWYQETVNDDGEERPVKQLIREADGSIRRYSWRHIEDDAGTLPDQVLDPAFPGLDRISREAFYDLWAAPAD